MTAPQYTDQQQRAIAAREVSLALAAGAGCGKTFVLTERFLVELAPVEGRDAEQRLSELVAITFTDAAARELRSRIRKLVYDKMMSADAAERPYWSKLQRAVDGCRVSTIHSFCGNLIRSHAFDLGLDPLFTVLDGPASQVLEADAIEDTLRNELTARQADAMAIAEAWGIEGAKSRIARLMKQRREPEFEKWLAASPADLLEAWAKFHREEVWPRVLEEFRELATELIGLLSQFAPPDPQAADQRQELIDLLTNILQGESTAEELLSIKEKAKVKKPFTKKAWGDDELYANFRDSAKAVRDKIDRVPHADFTTDEAHRAAKLALHLGQVAQLAAERYTAAKTQRNALDYDDLMTWAHRLLTAPAHRGVQESLRSGIGILFVDEFQDTNQLQVDLVKALVGDVAQSGKLFFVGDEKQSIYRFRGAEPQVFIDLRQEVAHQWRLPLSKNFRSQPAILDFVNTLFENVFGEGYQPLDANRPQVAPEPAVEFLWTPQPGNKREKGWVEKSRCGEARAIAVRLRELIDSEHPVVPDSQHPAGVRGVQPGDIAILFRSLSDVQYYEEALRQQQIDYYLVGGHAFYTQQEVYDVLHLARSISSECDELSLAGVLRSPFFSLADETLLWLGGLGQSLEVSLFAAKLPAGISSEERAKVARAAATLMQLRSEKEKLPPAALLAKAMELTGYDATLLAEFMGERKLANVYKLMEQARAATDSGVGSLDNFVTQLAEFTTATPKEALATTSPQTSSVVRLMTIHQSKGLEFPVVVVPDLNRRDPSNSDQVAYNPRTGILVKPDAEDADDTTKTNEATTGLTLHKYMEKLASIAESDRVFYVACTRAADYLLLSSGVNDLSHEKLEGAWIKRLAETFDLTSGELLTATAGGPQVRATVAAAPTASSSPQGSRVNWLQQLEKAAKVPADPTVEQLAAPYVIGPAARRRFSVTRLSGQIIPAGGEWWNADELEPEDRPTGDTQLDPLGLGTLVHAVLERIDFTDEASSQRWCQNLAPHHHPLNSQQAALAADDLVQRYLASELAADMRQAEQVHRELEFTLCWPLESSEVNPRYLQGYLDCLYQTSAGDWRVVDYKTNHVTAGAVPQLAAKYELQMLVYGLAVEQTWGTGPKELVLHFMRPGVDHIIEWNPAARTRAIELVNIALETIAR